MAPKTFVPAQHPRGINRPAGRPPAASPGSFVTAEPKPDALSDVSEAMAAAAAADALVTAEPAGPGAACSACGELATQKIGYGNPVWGWNFSCVEHARALGAEA